MYPARILQQNVGGSNMFINSQLGGADGANLGRELAKVLLLSAHYPFQIFPPFAMNALNAWICTTKPLLHPPPTKRGSKLYTLFHY